MNKALCQHHDTDTVHGTCHHSGPGHRGRTPPSRGDTPPLSRSHTPRDSHAPSCLCCSADCSLPPGIRVRTDTPPSLAHTSLSRDGQPGQCHQPIRGRHIDQSEASSDSDQALTLTSVSTVALVTTARPPLAPLTAHCAALSPTEPSLAAAEAGRSTGAVTTASCKVNQSGTSIQVT